MPLRRRWRTIRALAPPNDPYRESERQAPASVPPPEDSERTPSRIKSLESPRTGSGPPAPSASSFGWLLSGVGFGLSLVVLTVAPWPFVELLPEGVRRVLMITIHNVRYRGDSDVPLWPLYLAAPLWIVPRILSARAWRRELAWVRALPFEVPNYARAMGRWLHRSDFKMTLEFVADTLDEDTLHDYLDLDTGTWTFQIAGRCVTLERSPSLVRRGDESNRRLLLWFHALVEKKLLPLHRAHPIRCFSFRDRGSAR